MKHSSSLAVSTPKPTRRRSTVIDYVAVLERLKTQSMREIGASYGVSKQAISAGLRTRGLDTPEKTSCVSGHPYPAEADTVRDRRGNRHCVSCERAWDEQRLDITRACARCDRPFHPKRSRPGALFCSNACGWWRPRRTHCPRGGHEFTEETTVWLPTPGSSRLRRTCRTCRNDWQRSSYAARKRLVGIAVMPRGPRGLGQRSRSANWGAKGAAVAMARYQHVPPRRSRVSPQP